jgi:hypothetical protein
MSVMKRVFFAAFCLFYIALGACLWPKTAIALLWWGSARYLTSLEHITVFITGLPPVSMVFVYAVLLVMSLFLMISGGCSFIFVVFSSDECWGD